jgi:glycosyltransferase involved in cell wall biosynthesis
MNPEYLVVAGWLWRLRGKKIALWYTHKSVDLKLRIAEHFATFVFTASKGSFRLESKKVEVVGHGIDAEFFSPDVKVPRSEHWLSVGRLMKSKRHDLAMRVAADVKKELRIAGEGPERERLKALARELGTSVEFLGALTQEQLRDEYRSAALLIHRSETGSLDKVVLEALLCDLPVDSTNSECKEIAAKGREYVRTHHSLSSLIPRIVEKLTV